LDKNALVAIEREGIEFNDDPTRGQRLASRPEQLAASREGLSSFANGRPRVAFDSWRIFSLWDHAFREVLPAGRPAVNDIDVP